MLPNQRTFTKRETDMKTHCVTHRLAIAFGVLIAIIVTVGYWGADRLAEMNGKVQTIVGQRWQKVQLSREALLYSALNSRITMQIFLLQDKKEIEPLLEQRAKNTEKISELMKTIEARLESDEEKALVANVWTNRIPYVNSYKVALNLLLKEGKPEAGRKMMSGVVLTNLIAYHKSWEAFVEHQGDQMDAAGKLAEARYITARQQLIILVVAATVLAVFIALFVIRNLTREIASRQKAEESLQYAHDDLELRVRNRTEELSCAHLELKLREERFRKLSQCAPIGIFATDAAGLGLFHNPHWCEITGLSEAEALGEGWQKAVHPEDAQRIRSTWWDCVREGQAFDAEFRFRRPSGEARWVHAQAAIVRSESGDITGHVGTTEDITERRLAQKRLAENEHRLRSILAAEPECVKLVATDGSLLDMNPAGLRMIEANSLEQVVGQCTFGLIAPEYLSRYQELNAAVFRGESRIVEFEIIGLRGARRWMESHACPLRDADGQIFAQLAVSRDITARKQSEAELAKSQKELVETSRQAGMAEVATEVLHNVGNVLNSVNVSATCVTDGLRKSKVVNLSRVVALLREHEAYLADYLTHDPKGKQVTSYLAQLTEHLATEQAVALDELSKLRKNIEHIKDIVSMQQSFAKVSGMKEAVPVTDLLEDALQINISSILRHDVQVIKEFQPTPPVVVEKHKALQILVNLIRNAKQSCDEANRDVKLLTLRIMNGEGCVRISVSDNGVGIPPENLNRIFNHGFTTKKDGHGFGLHSGANAVKEMGGLLNVHSDGVGKGATFTVELPVTPTNSPT